MALTPAQIHSKLLSFRARHPIRSWVISRCTGNQRANCKDLIAEWSRFLGKSCPASGDAGTLMRVGAFDPRQWRRVLNTPSGVPPEGAIVVVQHYSSFYRRWTGHVMIALAKCTSHVIYSYDQNWSYAFHITAETHTGYYTSNWRVLGWWIPI